MKQTMLWSQRHGFESRHPVKDCTQGTKCSRSTAEIASLHFPMATKNKIKKYQESGSVLALSINK